MKIAARTLLVVSLLSCGSLYAENAVTRAVRTYLSDAKSLATAPVHWKAKQWTRFGEGTLAVATVYAADQKLYDVVQRNRSACTDRFAKDITPFGGQRAVDLSLLMIAAGVLTHQTETRDAGRDSLESELWAAGVVTPLLKHAFGRARPSQNEGARSFNGFTSSSHYESFPSGHATNVFAFETAVAGHYDNWVVPAIVYSVASGVAFSRVNDRAHFPSDVVAGALIGRAVAKGVLTRHRRSAPTWFITPLAVHGHAGMLIHLCSSCL